MLLLFLFLLLLKAELFFRFLHLFCARFSFNLVLFVLKFQRLLRLCSNSFLLGCLFCFSLPALGTYSFFFKVASRNSRTERQLLMILQKELINFIIFRLGAESNFSDLVLFAAFTFIQSNPERIFKQNRNLCSDKNSHDFSPCECPDLQKSEQPKQSGVRLNLQAKTGTDKTSDKNCESFRFDSFEGQASLCVVSGHPYSAPPVPFGNNGEFPVTQSVSLVVFLSFG